MTTETQIDRSLIGAAAAFNAKCKADVDAICARGPIAARRACDDLIARRVEHDGDITNLLASIIRAVKDADVSVGERAYLDIAAEVLGEAQAEIVARHRKTRSI